MVGITQSGFVSGSGYISQGKVKSTYSSVNDISGIGAGTGGYNIYVGGNTDLNGAVITSTADAAKNVLDTGTLSFENLHNVSEYDAKQTTVSGGSTASSNIASVIAGLAGGNAAQCAAGAGVGEYAAGIVSDMLVRNCTDPSPGASTKSNLIMGLT
jgi:filamentous hemagglutinin